LNAPVVLAARSQRPRIDRERARINAHSVSSRARHQAHRRLPGGLGWGFRSGRGTYTARCSDVPAISAGGLPRLTCIWGVYVGDCHQVAEALAADLVDVGVVVCGRVQGGHP
jgi:hypothetical protein